VFAGPTPYLRPNIGIGDFLVQAIQGFAYMCLLSSLMRKAANWNQPSPIFFTRLYPLEGEPRHRLVAWSLRISVQAPCGTFSHTG